MPGLCGTPYAAGLRPGGQGTWSLEVTVEMGDRHDQVWYDSRAAPLCSDNSTVSAFIWAWSDPSLWCGIM